MDQYSPGGQHQFVLTQEHSVSYLLFKLEELYYDNFYGLLTQHKKIIYFYSTLFSRSHCNLGTSKELRERLRHGKYQQHDRLLYFVQYQFQQCTVFVSYGFFFFFNWIHVLYIHTSKHRQASETGKLKPYCAIDGNQRASNN